MSDDSNDFSLTLDAFVRSVSINQRSRHEFFLGAGASITSGVPSAEACLWQWKRDIFITKNPGLRTQFENVSLPGVQRAIQRWLDSQGEYPSQGDPNEYGYYVEQCYPISSDRTRFFENLTAQKAPYIGYKLLCLLAEAEIVKAVWTTNFDGLTGRAAAMSKLSAIEVGLDTTDRLNRVLRRGELLCVSLHGDYRFDALKNTPQELRQLDLQIREALIGHLQSANLIVIGYSGRDDSVMETLYAAYSQQGSGRLYWCGHGDGEPPQEVQDLLRIARAHGREAYHVPTNSFDDAMERLALHCLSGDLASQVRTLYDPARDGVTSAMPPFTLPPGATVGAIKSNAFPIELPSEVLLLRASGFDQVGAWRALKEQVGSADIVAGFHGRDVIALGTTEDVRTVFAPNLQGEVTFSPVSDGEIASFDTATSSLFLQAIVRSLANLRGLQTDGRGLVWTSSVASRHNVSGVQYLVFDAAKLFLRRYGGKNHLVVKPTIKATKEDGTVADGDTEKELKRRVLTKQYNREFNAALKRWQQTLFPTLPSVIEYPPERSSPFRFTVRKGPIFAKISRPRANSGIKLPEAYGELFIQSGTEYVEPNLLFSRRVGQGVIKDTHPLRGITQNRPYDYSLTTEGMKTDVRIAVVCPQQDAGRVAKYLATFNGRQLPTSKSEYLLEYPGFSSAFGLPLVIPQPGEPAWVDCAEPNSGLDMRNGPLALGRRITSYIETLRASGSPHLVVVYIPERWKKWERYDVNGEHFNLHDFVKAFCVERGIASQFLRQATLTKQHQCEVLWWLGLAFYIKSFRTPWVLENLDTETAFMGLGFSIDPSARRGDHILIGCSHIYNSAGQGLRYRLSRLENAVIRKDNPFMSQDDARRMGESVRQLFFESLSTLPRRVVIHKRTPFNKAEREGLLEGLAGIDSVDMLEISTDSALRYVASAFRAGQLQEDAYPVRRGTAVVLDRRRALLWSHGTTAPLDPDKRYYLGKSRIPAPLIITRHNGTTSPSMLVNEVLGLSKMGWNSFDMYSTEPATLQSSNKIARVGEFLRTLSSDSYDYRLFI